MKATTSQPAVFLDRDGVLNEAVVKDGVPYPPADVHSLRLCDGAEAACRQLAEAGFPLFVVTNQPDIARGTTTTQTVEAINAHLQSILPITEVAVCPHDDVDECACRKPKPGLLLELADRHNIDLSRSVMVGDRWRDLEAGVAAGTSTIWIDRMYTEKQPLRWDLRCDELISGVDWILKRGASYRIVTPMISY